MNNSKYPNSLIENLVIQARVIHALIMREVLTRYGRHNIGFVWIFAENFLFTSAVVFLWVLTHGTNIRGLDIISFSVIGYSFVLVWRNCVNRVVMAVEPNKSLLYHKQVKIVDIYLARIWLELISSTGSFMFVYTLLFTFNFVEFPKLPHLFVFGWISLLLVSGCIALVIGPWSEISDLLDRVWHILTYVLFPMSGAFFAVDWLPVSVQNLVLWIPLVHCAEIIRAGYYGESYIAHYSLNYLIVFSIISLITGLILTRKVEKNLVME